MANEMRRKKAMKTFYEYTEKNGYTPLQPYVNGTTKINVRCPNNHVWKVEPSRLKRGSGCPDCNWRGATVAGKKFVARIIALGGKVIGPYVNSDTAVACICPKGHPCFAHPGSMNAGHGMCGRCGNKVDEAEEYFHQLAREAGITVLGPYINRATHIDCLCKYKHPCSILPGSFKRGCGYCRTCAGNDMKVAREKFLAIAKENSFEVLEEYKNGKNKIDVKCPKNHIRAIRPSSVIRKGISCPTCSPVSVGETKVADALTLLNIPYRQEFKLADLSKTYRYDFELSNRKIIIEADGLQHFKCSGKYSTTPQKLQTQQLRDVIKTVNAEIEGYTIIRFDYKWYKKPVADFVKFIKDVIDIPYEDRPYNIYSTPELYTWIDEIRNSVADE